MENIVLSNNRSKCINNMYSLGIDFGTTFTKASLYNSATKELSKVPLNPNVLDFGFAKSEYAMPTVVSYLDGNFQVGQDAVNSRLMADISFDNFKVFLENEEDKDTKAFNLTYTNLITQIIDHVRVCAEKALPEGGKIDNVVLTVPAVCMPNGRRWKRMLEAGKEVFGDNLEINIIPEPVAAGYCLLGKKIQQDRSLNGKYYVIYDFGGGTFDCCVFKVQDEQILLVGKSVGSDENLKWGGIYLDNLIRRDYISSGVIIQGLVASLKDAPMRRKREIEETLRTEPVKAKISLSDGEVYNFKTGDHSISRAKFESLAKKMLEDTISKTVGIIKDCENDGEDVSLKNIDTVFLVGGSSRIPLISKLWEEKRIPQFTFGVQSLDKHQYKLVTTEIEIVASGAAMYPGLRIKPERMIALGIDHYSHERYNEAALCFNNANSPDGYFMLGMLYFEGKIGSSPNYPDAIRNFILSDSSEANAVISRCAYMGQQGVPQDISSAYEYLAKSGNCLLAQKLNTVLKIENPTPESIEELRTFDPLMDFINSYLLSDKGRYASLLKEEREEQPSDPDLDFLDLISKANWSF